MTPEQAQQAIDLLTQINDGVLSLGYCISVWAALIFVGGLTFAFWILVFRGR